MNIAKFIRTPFYRTPLVAAFVAAARLFTTRRKNKSTDKKNPTRYLLLVCHQFRIFYCVLHFTFIISKVGTQYHAVSFHIIPISLYVFHFMCTSTENEDSRYEFR